MKNLATRVQDKMIRHTQNGNLSSAEINVKGCQLLELVPRETGSQILSRVCGFCELMGWQNQGKTVKGNRKGPFLESLENTTVAPTNVLSIFTRSHIFSVVVDNQHRVED